MVMRALLGSLLLVCCRGDWQSMSNIHLLSSSPQLRHRELSSSKRSFNFSQAYWLDDTRGRAGDEFGEAVSVQQQVALVGSPMQSDFPLYEVSDGKVFVIVDSKGTNEWEVIREVMGEDATEYFGMSLALHVSNGNYFAVVGAPRGNRYGQFSGGVYYFDVEIDPTKDQAYPTHLVQKERHGGANFGCSVAISEINGQIRVAVGATGHRQKGAVFMYTRANDGTLTNEVILYGSVSKGGGNFGYSIAFNDNMVAVGAPVLQHGMVFLFASTESGTFEQVKYMSAPASTSEDITHDDDNIYDAYYYFGGSLAIGNGFLFVGTPLHNLRGQNSGSVYVYDLSDMYNPDLMQTLFPPVQYPTGLAFGWSMSYDVVNTKLIVGTCNRQSSSASDGKAFVFQQKGKGYFLEASLYADKYTTGRVKLESRSALFGKGVAIYSDNALVGAPFGNGEQYDSGDIYFFRAQTKSEYSSTGSDTDLSTNQLIDFSSTNVQLIAVVGAFLILLSILYRRYSTHGDEEGFGEFLSTGCVTDDGEDPSFNEDSEHSNHPMIVRSSKEGKKGKSKKGKSGSKKSKSSKSRTAYSSIKDDDL